jgi:hypothetical protein
MNEVALRRRIAALVVATLPVVMGTTAAAATLVDDAQVATTQIARELV